MMAQGKIRYLALAAKTRDPKYPDLPTVNELLGSAGKSFVPYRAIGLWMVKKDMPTAYQKALISSFKVALHDPEVKLDTETRAYKYWPTNDADTPKVLRDEQRQYLNAIKEFNIEMRQ
jgi:tripartite-type tricarboxylate transporter receptor subunit TctC